MCATVEMVGTMWWKLRRQLQVWRKVLAAHHKVNGLVTCVLTPVHRDQLWAQLGNEYGRTLPLPDGVCCSVPRAQLVASTVFWTEDEVTSLRRTRWLALRCLSSRHTCPSTSPSVCVLLLLLSHLILFTHTYMVICRHLPGKRGLLKIIKYTSTLVWQCTSSTSTNHQVLLKFTSTHNSTSRVCGERSF